MTIKLITTDIDGTILKYDGTFNQPVYDCIQKLEHNGVKVILITGRMHKSAKKIADMFNLQNPIVSFQGALIKDNSKEEKTLYARYIPIDTTKNILKWSKSQKIDVNLYMDDELYSENENGSIKQYTKAQNIPYFIKDFESLKIENVNKVLLIDYEDAEHVTEIKNQLTKDYPELYIVKSTEYFCEVCHPEATKGDGVRFLQQYYGITKEETLAIGDHDNDIELLQAAGVRAAMGNGSDDLKNVADFVTDTVDNDGFVKAVEKYVLNAGANV